MNTKLFFKKKKIFDALDIQELRDILKKRNIFNQVLKLSDLNFEDSLSKYIFSRQMIEFIQSNLNEEFYFLHNFVIQKNNRTFKKTRYHKDSGKRHQSKILSKKKNFYGKIGIPLQDNIKGEGGGIDFLTPMIFDNLSDENFLKNKIRALYYFLQDKLTETHCNSKVGDIIFFNALLSHRTSLTKLEKLDFIKDKYVIYFQIANLNVIIDTLKLVRKNENISLDKINKNLIIKKINGLKIKILNQELSSEIGSFIGR